MRGALDVGTNTVRLLIGSARQGRVEPHRYFRRITRLGGGFTPDQGLAADAAERTLAALEDASSLLRRHQVEQVRAVGTAVLRQALNGSDFARRAAARTGVRLQIITGEEEARLTALGVRSALEPKPESCLILDIGGGSTEFILWHQGTTLLQRSFELGVVRLAEDLPDPADQDRRILGVLQALGKELDDRNLVSVLESPDLALVGTAGTVTTLAALHLGMAEYDWRRINNQVLRRRDLDLLLRRLAPLSSGQREALPGMEQGRGDLIVPGLRIVLAVLDHFRRERLTVSDFGLLEGVLLDLG